MKMKDSTILRIKVPAHLYESVKAQLTLNEANNFGMPGSTTVKEKKSSGDKPKTSAPKKAAAPKAKKAETPENVGEAPKDGHKKAAPAKKKMGLEELKALAELLNGHIAKLEEKDEKMEEEGQIEETKASEEGEQ